MGAEPDVHEDYVSAYDLGRFAESARFVRHFVDWISGGYRRVGAHEPD